MPRLDPRRDPAAVHRARVDRAAYTFLLPVAADELGIGPEGLGLLLGAAGTSGLVSGLLNEHLQRALGQGGSILVGLSARAERSSPISSFCMARASSLEAPRRVSNSQSSTSLIASLTAAAISRNCSLVIDTRIESSPEAASSLT
jgi:hypothetical protein